MRFGQFLIMEGAVAEEAVAEALVRQRRSAVPLGELAIREGRLEQRQVRELLRVQARSVEYKRLGQLACAAGLLHEADVVHLLALQRRDRPKLGEILIRRGLLKVEQRDSLLRRFRAFDLPSPAVAGAARSGPPRVPTRPGSHVPVGPKAAD